MTVAQVNEIETTKNQLIEQRAMICKLHDVFSYKSGEEYDAALVAAGLFVGASPSDIKSASNAITAKINALPKVTMRDFMAWKKSQ